MHVDLHLSGERRAVAADADRPQQQPVIERLRKGHGQRLARALAGSGDLPGGDVERRTIGWTDREAALEVRKRFVMDLDTLQSKFLALSDAIPADKYAWRPGPGVRQSSPCRSEG